MTDLEDAQVRLVSAEALHLRLCEALDRREPVWWLVQQAYRDLVLAKCRVADLLPGGCES